MWERGDLIMGTVASVILGVIGLLAFLTWVGQVVATTADMFRSRDKPRLGSWKLWFLIGIHLGRRM